MKNKKEFTDEEFEMIECEWALQGVGWDYLADRKGRTRFKSNLANKIALLYKEKEDLRIELHNLRFRIDRLGVKI